MSVLRKPCLTCGEMTDNGSRCEDCRLFTRGLDRRSRPDRRSNRARGYDTQWRNVSERARRAQPFCEVCGATEDLQADHTPRAWKRRAEGLAVRVEDVRVLCGPCNRAAGEARPGSERYAAAERRARRRVARRRVGR